ncbi:MAG: HAD-IIIA family hydrolase [Candidatus Riflebacteria bacterium]|nr:HAD-IIIA family hydrolase [Candidatus Riflebacteria bacterium]
MRFLGTAGLLVFLGTVLLLLRGWVRPAVAEGPAGDRPTARRLISPAFRPPAAGGKVRLALFDADSTLRVAPSGSPSANTPDDVAVLPLVAPVLARLASEGYLIAIQSNQAGIEHGYITLEIAEKAFQNTLAQLAAQGGVVHYYDFAEKKDGDRKPGTGMGERLATLVQERLGREIDWEGSFMVGDSAWKAGVDQEPDGTPGDDIGNNDRQFAENLRKKFGGVAFHHPRDFFGWAKFGVKNFKTWQDLQEAGRKHPELRTTP